MRNRRQWKPAARVIFFVVVLALFYVFQSTQGSETPQFLPTPFRAVTTTITRFIPVPELLTVPPSPSKLKLEKHIYRPDGLLEVNYDGPHPIFELIRRAEKDWEEKLSRASKTLAGAVEEYRRRYKRDPPKGFDLW